MCVGCLRGKATASGAEVRLTKLALYSKAKEAIADQMATQSPSKRSKIAIKVAPASRRSEGAPGPLPPIVWGKGAAQSKLAVHQSSIIWYAPIQFTKF